MGETVTSGMQTFVTALQTGLSGDALWGEIAPLAPFLAAICLFAFGFYVFRRTAKGASKGKFRA